MLKDKPREGQTYERIKSAITVPQLRKRLLFLRKLVQSSLGTQDLNN